MCSYGKSRLAIGGVCVYTVCVCLYAYVRLTHNYYFLLCLQAWMYSVCVLACVCACGAPYPLVTGSKGRKSVCACVCVCIFMQSTVCHLFLFTLFTFSREVASLSLQCAHLFDGSAPEAIAAAKYHTPGCTVCAFPSHPKKPAIMLLVSKKIIQEFHLDEPSLEGPYSTCRITDDFFYSSVSLIPQELKSWAEGR